MREQLEAKLEGSLAKLGPGKTLVPSIMTTVLASSSAKVATIGSTGTAILSALAKFTPFKWFFAFFWLIIPVTAILPGLFFERWRRRDEQRNYRDPKGFRANLYRQFDKNYLVFFVFIIGMTFVFIATTIHAFGLEYKNLFLILGMVTFAVVVFGARQLEISCGWYQFFFLLFNLVMTGLYLCIGLGRLPITAVFPAIMISTLFTVFTNQNRLRPLRMDYNLFLRAMQGMLPPTGLTAQEKFAIHFDRSALRAFARFLASGGW